jgi:excinuclease ABC subunit B
MIIYFLGSLTLRDKINSVRIVLYADGMTCSILAALGKTEQRRALQMAYNQELVLVPQTIKKPIREKVVEITDTMRIPRFDIPSTARPK